MITTVLFDLDGTLLPMDLEVFFKQYMEALARKLAPRGYEPEKLFQAIRQGIRAMVTNDGSRSNETVFWDVFTSAFGDRVLTDKPFFEDFYHTEFQELQKVCGFDPRAAETIRQVKEAGYQPPLPCHRHSEPCPLGGTDPGGFRADHHLRKFPALQAAGGILSGCDGGAACNAGRMSHGGQRCY